MRGIRAFAVLGCALMALAGCSSPRPPEKIAPPAKTTAAPGLFADYVALGDSFTAGPLIAPAIEGAPSECVRSGANYPSYLASYLNVTTLADVSCSSAVTADLYSPQSRRTGLKPNPKTDTRAQLDAIRPSTDLVTLGIGGNDSNLFADVIGRCVYTATRSDANAPCRDSFRPSGVDVKMQDAKAIQPRIEAAIDAIARRAPKAKVIVVGYLGILSGKGSCAAMPLKPADAIWTDSIERRINTSLRQAAQRTGASFVDAYAVSKGHDACTGKAAWVNGSETDFFRAAAFHPFREGMDAVAREAYRVATNSTAPKSPTLEKLAAIPRR